jgi:hypothetical protein
VRISKFPVGPLFALDPDKKLSQANSERYFSDSDRPRSSLHEILEISRISQQLLKIVQILGIGH